MPSSIGIPEATTEVIGGSDSDIGGFNLTRLTADTPVFGPIIPATLTWDGTIVVLATSTAGVIVGDFIRMGSNQWFEVETVNVGVSFVLSNPENLGIPSGTELSYKASALSFATSVAVETTLDWPTSGSVAIDGVKYSYTGKTLSPPTLTGLTHLQGGSQVAGIKRFHNKQAGVLDVSRSRSSLDQLRRAMLVDYASGEDLSALGRNLGVDRYPFLSGDDQFRSIVKALAYNPRGTVYGLELALDALVGSGNYEIYEDLIRFPCTVFIKLKGTAATSDVSFGKAYLAGPEYQIAASTTLVNMDNDVAESGVVEAVRYAPVNEYFDARSTYPSTMEVDAQFGDGSFARNPWVLSGGTEGVEVIKVSSTVDGNYLHLVKNGLIHYEYEDWRCPDNSGFEIEMISMPDATPTNATPSLGLKVRISGRDIGVGMWYTGPPLGAATTLYGFCDWNTPVGIGPTGSFTRLPGLNNPYLILKLVREDGSPNVSLYGDGVLLSTQALTAFPVAGAAGRFIQFGEFQAESSNLRVRSVSVKVVNSDNYWNAEDTDGDTPSVIRLHTASTPFIAADLGKQVRITGGTPDQNIGAFEISNFVDSSNVDLQGHIHPQASVASTNPTRVTVPISGPNFSYPHDIGKKIQLSGSVAGNDGEWVISALLQEGTLVDLSTFATDLEEVTNVCELTGPTCVTETGLTWQLNPVFLVDVGGVEWGMTDAGSVIGNALTLRSALPITDVGFNQLLEVVYTQVLTGQTLLDNNVSNVVEQTLPALLFAYYPFYIADPLGYVRVYTGAVTAAGVIPDFLVE